MTLASAAPGGGHQAHGRAGSSSCTGQADDPQCTGDHGGDPTPDPAPGGCSPGPRAALSSLEVGHDDHHGGWDWDWAPS